MAMVHVLKIRCLAGPGGSEKSFAWRIRSANTLASGGVLQIVMLGLYDDYKLLYGPWIVMIFQKCRL